MCSLSKIIKNGRFFSPNSIVTIIYYVNLGEKKLFYSEVLIISVINRNNRGCGYKFTISIMLTFHILKYLTIFEGMGAYKYISIPSKI